MCQKAPIRAAHGWTLFKFHCCPLFLVRRLMIFVSAFLFFLVSTLYGSVRSIWVATSEASLHGKGTKIYPSLPQGIRGASIFIVELAHAIIKPSVQFKHRV